MPIKIFNEKEKAGIEKQLHEKFGIKSLPGKILMLGAERLFFFTGELSDEELKKIELITPIEKIGCYFAKLIDEKIKLTIEGTQILKNQISKNIFEINEKQAEEWMSGRELNIKTGMKGFVVIKNQKTEDLLGCGKASENKITNFIPKSRRLKART
jgi:NOL1/NOP2/fmu family ribosome biogenesis protein